jgi:hypothetical protein
MILLGSTVGDVGEMEDDRTVVEPAAQSMLVLYQVVKFSKRQYPLATNGL